MDEKKYFLVRFDSDGITGVGHFSRCYALGQQLLDSGENVLFVSKHINANIEKVLSEADQQYLKVPDHICWSEEVDFIKKQFSGECSGFILDIATLYAFKDLKGVAAYLKDLRKYSKTILLDGMGGNALSTKIQELIDVIVMPYFGASELMPELKQETVYLMGPKYYVLPSEYREDDCSRREIRKAADRVLVTLGGADPLNVTIKVIDALLLVEDSKLDVRLVIGPNFSSELKKEIQDMIGSSHHCFTVVDCSNSLFDHMLWCDVAITSSGLTKYELAVTGTPSLQISFNRDHAYVNEFFVRHGSIKNLGIHSDIGVDLVAVELKRLLHDYEGRKRMSCFGQSLLDTHGVNRVIDAMRS